jgi:hypothetical protein
LALSLLSQQVNKLEFKLIEIIIIIIIGKDTISFMQGIYTYIPETNHVPKEYNVYYYYHRHHNHHHHHSIAATLVNVLKTKSRPALRVNNQVVPYREHRAQPL